MATKWPNVKRLAAPTLATFLCSLAIVIKPVAVLGGPYAFLVLTINILFFFSGVTVGGQLENIVLGLLGALFGLAWSCIVIAIIASLNRQNGGDEAVGSRVLAAFFLAIQACVCGYVRSHSPRLTSLVRISLFHSIWLLTSELSRTDLPAYVPLQLLYPTLFACLASFLSTILFPKTSVKKCVSLTQQAFQTSEHLLQASIDGFFLTETSSPTGESSNASSSSQISTLKSSLQAQSSALPQAFAQATYEISYTRFSTYRIYPFLDSVRKLKQDLASGTNHFARPNERISNQRRSSEPRLDEGHLSFESRRAPFEPPTRRFLGELVLVFRAINNVLDGQTGEDLMEVRKRMGEARETFVWVMNCELDKAVEGWEHLVKSGDHTKESVVKKAYRLDKNLLRISLFMYKIIAVSQTLDHALQSAAELRAHTSTNSTLRLPTLTRAWLGSNSLSAKWDESAQDQSPDDDEVESHQVDQSRQEIQASIAEAFLTPRPTRWIRKFRKSPLKWCYGTFLVLWDSHRVLELRLTLAHFTQALKARKINFTYSFKLGFGIMLLSLPAFLPPSTDGRAWFKDIRGQWIPISYLFVLDVTSGQTWRVGTFRVMGTVLGAILAGVIWLIARNNPYALVVLTSMYGALAGYIILFTTFPGVGVVLSITVPPIVFIPYLDLSPSRVIDLAWKRTATVCIGIAAAVIVTEFVFPARSRKLFLGTMALVMDDLTRMYLAMSRSLIQQGPYSFDSRALDKLQRRVEGNLNKGSSYLGTLKLELTLIHKPLRMYRQTIVAARNLSDLFISLSIIRQKIPREETVHEVLEQRKELISSLMIHLFACSHAFRSRLPLPQFLPSPGRAVRTWEDKVLQGLISPENDGEQSESAFGDLSVHGKVGDRARLHRDTAFLYAFAEAEALEETTKVMEDLTELTRALFGTSTFFNHQKHHDFQEEAP